MSRQGTGLSLGSRSPRPLIQRALTLAGVTHMKSEDSEDDYDNIDGSWGLSPLDSAERRAQFDLATVQSPEVGMPRSRRGSLGCGPADDSPFAGLGCQTASIKGMKPDCPNQDAWIVMRSPLGFSVYGVFDGHGKAGHLVSAFVKRALPRIILTDPRLGKVDMPTIVTEAFERMTKLIADSSLPTEKSGTTATVVVHDHTKKILTVAHIGDSGCALVHGPNYRAKYLTPDHKPNLPEESKRIKRAGGEILFDGRNHRMYRKGGGPQLNMSRCFGDLWGQKAGIITVPDIVQIKLTPADHTLLVCSDGVWEVMKPQEAAEAVRKESQIKPDNVARALAKTASGLWTKAGDASDDITVLMVNLLQHPRLLSSTPGSEAPSGDAARASFKRGSSSRSVTSSPGRGGTFGATATTGDSSTRSATSSRSEEDTAAKLLVATPALNDAGASLSERRNRLGGCGSSSSSGALTAAVLQHLGPDDLIRQVASTDVGEETSSAWSTHTPQTERSSRSSAQAAVGLPQVMVTGHSRIDFDDFAVNDQESAAPIENSVNTRRAGCYFVAPEHNAL